MGRRSIFLLRNKKILFFICFIFFVPLLAQAEENGVKSEEEVIPTQRPESIYDKLYPYYVELCALSRIQKLGAPKGGSAGHAVLYLKGACRDENARYPRIKVCEEGSVDLNNSNSGVGISVNKVFKNVNWVAVPTKKLFYYGGLTEKDRLTQERFEKTLKEAKKSGIFNGIELHEEYLQKKPADMTLEHFIAEESIGTDFALRFGRSLFCERLPVTRPMLGKIVEFLNDLNDEYASGKADYNWNGYHDNCAHTVHNALSAANIWKPKAIDKSMISQLFSIAIPANEFANLALLVNKYPLENPRKIYRDLTKRKALHKYDWLPMRHGAMLKTVGVQEKNDIYNTDFDIFVLEGPISKVKSRFVRWMLGRNRYLRVKDNLLYYKKRYESILNGRTRPNPLDFSFGLFHKSFNKFEEKYYSYIQSQLEDTKEKLKKAS